MIEGALILLAGLLVGRLLPGRRRRPKPLKPAPPPKPVCGCSHGLHDHDPATNACNGKTKAYRWNGTYGREVLDKYVSCTCKQYTGPSIYPEYIAREIAG